jgi:hypothetical protein
MGFRFRYPGFPIREGADPKGAEGGGGAKNPAAKVCTRLPRLYQVAPASLKDAAPQGRAPDSQLIPGPSRPPTLAVESDRVWKAPDHQPPTPGPSHARWKSQPPKSPPPGISTATHSHGEEEIVIGPPPGHASESPCCHTYWSPGMTWPPPATHSAGRARRRQRPDPEAGWARRSCGPAALPPARRPPTRPPIPRPSQNHLISTAAS